MTWYAASLCPNDYKMNNCSLHGRVKGESGRIVARPARSVYMTDVWCGCQHPGHSAACGGHYTDPQKHTRSAQHWRVTAKRQLPWSMCRLSGTCAHARRDRVHARHALQAGKARAC